MVISRIRKHARYITLVSLLGFGWHIASNHGLIGNLIYCFGPNGDVKIEAYCDLQVCDNNSIGHNLQMVGNQETNHLQAGHSDIVVSEICPIIHKAFGLGHLPAPKLKLLASDGINSINTSSLGIGRWSTYRPPTNKKPTLSGLRTIVLLN